MDHEDFYPDQVVPIILTALTAGVGILVLYFLVLLLNKTSVSRGLIFTQLRLIDILIGLTIYLKTSIDFAIYIGRLMSKYTGWKNRIMIEVGTSFGNIAGTFGILILWEFFREIKFLMAIMIVIAALVLLKLAEDGFEHVKDEEGRYKVSFLGLEVIIEKSLEKFNNFVAPVLGRLIPETRIKDDDIKRGFKALFILSLTVPFILGLDDFAGYIPLFNLVNVFGFATGVFLGHMVLLIALFMSPHTTIRIVKHPVISFLGSIAFIGLAGWGFFEAAKLVGI